MVESTSLENWSARKGTESSNLSPSALLKMIGFMPIIFNIWKEIRTKEGGRETYDFPWRRTINFIIYVKNRGFLRRNL